MPTTLHHLQLYFTHLSGMHKQSGWEADGIQLCSLVPDRPDVSWLWKATGLELTRVWTGMRPELWTRATLPMSVWANPPRFPSSGELRKRNTVEVHNKHVRPYLHGTWVLWIIVMLFVANWVDFPVLVQEVYQLGQVRSIYYNSYLRMIWKYLKIILSALLHIWIHYFLIYIQNKYRIQCKK